MQVPPTYQHSSFPTAHQQNPNASMATTATKHFPVGNVNQSLPQGMGTNLPKGTGS